ncbi:MAG TPA: lipid A deacylase LpxR family protein [Alphaproteobacteria bacterium]|nr:lipid A deacylase LpxR family protein [Alphaproteobacteria bacterium]
MSLFRVLLSSLLLPFCFGAAIAQDGGRDWTFNLLEENDSLADGDKHYTQGLYASLFAAHRAGEPWFARWNGVANAIFLPGTENGRIYVGGFIGQSIFTPDDLLRVPPDPNDRPYAGWLYGGVSLYRETDDALDRATLTLGLVGPGAGARRVQNGWHDIINPYVGSPQVLGWSYQLENEPGIVLSEERKWRFATAAGGLEFDILPEVNAAFGNIFTYAGAGAMVRVGRRLRVDWGQPRVQPALSGSDFVNQDGFAGRSFAWYLFAGTEGRLVARNIFLDGNTWEDGPSVDKKPLVADLTAGAAVVGRSFRLGASYTYRTDEFDGQVGRDDFVALNLSIQF